MPTHKESLAALSITDCAWLARCAKETASRRLREAGIEPVKSDGRTIYFDPRDALPILLGSGEKPDLSAERAKLARAQTEHTELKNALLRGDSLPREDVMDHWSNLVLSCKEKLRALPAHARSRIPSLSKKSALVLGELVDEALTELADDGVPRARRRGSDSGSS